MKCPHCGKKINPAAMMGAAGKGTPKNFSKAERKRRSERMKALNTKRRSKLENRKDQERHRERRSATGLTLWPKKRIQN